MDLDQSNADTTGTAQADPKEVFSSMRQAAARLALSVAVVRAAKNLGCEAFRLDGRIDGQKLRDWLAANADKLTEVENESKDFWVLQKTKFDAKRAELAFNKEAGLLISKQDVADQIEALWSAVKPVLRQRIEDELPNRVVGVDIHTARAEAAKVFDSLCQTFQGEMSTWSTEASNV